MEYCPECGSSAIVYADIIDVYYCLDCNEFILSQVRNYHE